MTGVKRMFISFSPQIFFFFSKVRSIPRLNPVFTAHDDFYIPGVRVSVYACVRVCSVDSGVMFQSRHTPRRRPVQLATESR